MLNSLIAIASHPLLWLGLLFTLIVVGMQAHATRKRSVDIPATWQSLRSWLRHHYVEVIFWLGLVVFAAAVHFYLFDAARAVAAMVDTLSSYATTDDDQTKPEDLRDLAQGIALLLGAMLAAATIPFTMLRTWINERTATAAEQGLVTDRINKAVEGLGAIKVVKSEGEEQTKPNLEVRIGAIYALERIASMNPTERNHILRILAHYIEQNSNPNVFDMPDYGESLQLWSEWGKRRGVTLESDIETAFETIHKIRERSEHQLPGLRMFVNLRQTTMRNVSLKRFLLFNAKMEAFGFLDASIVDVSFFYTSMREGAFHRAEILNCVFQAADFRGTVFDQCAISGLSIHEECLWEQSAFRDTDISHFGFSQEDLEEIFCDGSVKIPICSGESNVFRPKHWPEESLSIRDFLNEWWKWRKDPESYIPPDPLE